MYDGTSKSSWKMKLKFIFVQKLEIHAYEESPKSG